MLDSTLFFALAVPAVVLMGMSKGGFSGLGLISMPMLALAISPVTAAAIMLPILIVQDAVSVWAYRRDFDRKILLIMLPGALVGIAVGWFLAAQVPEAAVRVGVGLISVGFVLMYWGRRNVMAEGERTRGSTGAGVLWGAVSGYTSFVAHAGGPPFQVHVLPQRLSPQLYAGTSTMFFAAVNLVKVFPYVALGQFSSENLKASALFFPIAIASTFLGVWMVRRLDARRFFTLIYALSFVVGVKLIWDGIRDLI